MHSNPNDPLNETVFIGTITANILTDPASLEYESYENMFVPRFKANSMVERSSPVK